LRRWRDGEEHRIDAQVEGFNVYTTDLGEEGVDLGKLYDYDIILLDLNLPACPVTRFLRSLRVAKIKTRSYPLRPCRHRGQSSAASASALTIT